MSKKLETCTLHRYGKCVVLEGEFEGQEVDCSNAVNEDFGLTSLATGIHGPSNLKVEFRCDGMPPIIANLVRKRRCLEIALYERA